MFHKKLISSIDVPAGHLIRYLLESINPFARQRVNDNHITATGGMPSLPDFVRFNSVHEITWVVPRLRYGGLFIYPSARVSGT